MAGKIVRTTRKLSKVHEHTSSASFASVTHSTVAWRSCTAATATLCVVATTSTAFFSAPSRLLVRSIFFIARRWPTKPIFNTSRIPGTQLGVDFQRGLSSTPRSRCIPQKTHTRIVRSADCILEP